MARHGFNFIRALGLALAAGSFALLTGCATYAHTRTVVVEKPADQAEEPGRQADEFIGTPIMGDYDNDENLDFVLEVNDGGKVFKLEVHETAGGGNRELLENVRQKVNSMEDAGSIRVIGYYNSEYRGTNKEYGFLDLKMIAFYDEGTGKEEAYFTDPQDSQFYTDSDVTVIYAPGHHYSSVYYPRYVSPWWDSDGDGIPNRYDAWPLSYDPWYDYNMNYIPDWYDPYYVGYHPYWNYWDMNFWVGYHWYSPGYYYHGYTNYNYYHDYRTYTRLYDRRYVNNRDNSGRRLERMDAKSERVWRESYNNGTENRTRVASSSPGSRSYRGYESREPDNRVLVDPSLRTRATSTSTDVTDRALRSTGGDSGGDSFTRNRVVSDNTPDNTRTRDSGRVVTASDKSKTGEGLAVSSRTRAVSDRASVSSRSATATSGRERSTTSDSYRPSGSRSRNVTSGRTTTSSSTNPVYTPTSRSRSSDSEPAATTSTSRSRSSSSQPAATNSSSRSRSSGSQPAATSSSSRSRSSSAPAATSSSSRSRSSGGSQPAARSSSSGNSGSSARSSSSSSSSGSSRSRSSSGSSSSSSGRSRK